MNFWTNSKRPLTSPPHTHFRKIILQIVFGKRPKKTLITVVSHSQSQGTSEECNERKGTLGRVVLSFEPFLILGWNINIYDTRYTCSLYIILFVTTFIMSTARTNKAVQGEGGHSFEHFKGKEQEHIILLPYFLSFRNAF